MIFIMAMLYSQDVKLEESFVDKKFDVNIGVFALNAINNAFKMTGISNFTELDKNIYLGGFYLNKTKYCKKYLPSYACVD